MMMHAKTLVSCVAVTAVLVACAATPDRIAELEDARSEVQRVVNDPLAQEAAGQRVRQAEEALRLAQTAADKRAPIADIKEHAYAAARHAQIAQAQIREVRARKEIDNSEAERNRVLIEARTREANQALAQAKSEKVQAEEARSETEQVRAEAERLRTQIVALQAQQTERGMVLTLGDVLFDTARSTLKPGAAATMDRLADFMRSNDKFQLMIEGHADSQGSDAYNIELSTQRAIAVQGVLMSRGVDNRRMRVRGLGESFPVASNDSAEGRQRNRRVEIVFSDDHGEFMPGAERAAGR